MSSPGFDGATVVAFESRRADATTQLIEKRGGQPLSAPSMQEVPLSNHDEVFAFADKLFAGAVDMLICNTGVGTRMLIETMETKHDASEIRRALSALPIVARGPKPIRVLNKNDLPIALKASEPNTWEQILETLDNHQATYPLKGKQIAVQEYGRSNEELTDGLEQRGASVLSVPIYRWSLPDDTRPLENGIRAIAEGHAQVAMFTTRIQADHVLQLAAQKGLEQTLRDGLKNVMVASIGPVCTKGLESHGISVDVEPERPKLGILVRTAAEEMARHAEAA